MACATSLLIDKSLGEDVDKQVLEVCLSSFKRKEISTTSLRPTRKTKTVRPRNTHCLTQFLDLRRGYEDLHNGNMSMSADQQEQPECLPAGSRTTPPPPTLNSFLLMQCQNGQTGSEQCKDIVTPPDNTPFGALSLLITHHLVLCLWGSEASSPFM